MKILVADNYNNNQEVYSYDSEVIPNVGDFVHKLGHNYYEVIQRIFIPEANTFGTADIVLVSKEVKNY